MAALMQGRKRQKSSASYIDFTLLPVTSNIVERFFSQVKLNLTTMRNSLLPSTLETVMFLKANAAFMSKLTVQKALNFSN